MIVGQQSLMLTHYSWNIPRCMATHTVWDMRHTDQVKKVLLRYLMNLGFMPLAKGRILHSISRILHCQNLR